MLHLALISIHFWMVVLAKNNPSRLQVLIVTPKSQQSPPACSLEWNVAVNKLLTALPPLEICTFVLYNKHFSSTFFWLVLLFKAHIQLFIPPAVTGYMKTCYFEREGVFLYAKQVNKFVCFKKKTKKKTSVMSSLKRNSTNKECSMSVI